MIDKNKLIAALQEACEKDSFKELPSWIVNVINKQPKVDKWIPVSERLPERDVDVLVTDYVTGEVTVAYLNFCDSFVFYDGRGHGARAWQPLPKYEG